MPGYTLVDVGARYRFKAGDAPAQLRVQVENAGEDFAKHAAVIAQIT